MQLSGWIPIFWILLGMQFFDASNCNAVIKVKLWNYVNRKGHRHDGAKCDPGIFLSSCDPYFTIRISVVGGEQMKVTTEAVQDRNSVYFDNKIVNVDNPIVFRVSKYTGQLDVVVSVYDEDTLNSRDYIGTFRHRFSEDAVPFGQDIKTDWIPLDMSGKVKARLNLEITVQCREDYYGPHCESFCQPGRDSRIGFFSCSANGSQTCLPTFSPATNCRSTYCESQPCHNGGTCRNLPTGFLCACKEPFVGETCAVRLSTCQYKNPCHNGGTCHASDSWSDNYSCTCATGWRGQNCTEDIDECSKSDSSPCLNGGTCLNCPGRFHCLCPAGFRGDLCQEAAEKCAEGGGRCKNEPDHSKPDSNATSVV